MNEFDKAARFAARFLDPVGFFRWLLSPTIFEGWRWTDWLDTQSIPFPGEPDRRLDTVVAFQRLHRDAPSAAVVVEFLSEPRRNVLERLVEYGLRVRRGLPYETDPWVPYAVVGVLVNLTGQRMTGDWAMQPLDFGGLGLWARFEVRNLEALDAGLILSQIGSGETAACVLPWVALMQGGGQPNTIAEWKRLAERESNRERRREYPGLAMVFADLAGCMATWQRELEGWNVERSRITLEWEKRAEDRGRTLGGLSATRSHLLRVLRANFGAELPAEIVQTVEAQDDVDLLDRWFDRVLAADTLDQVRAALGLTNGD